MMWGYYGNGWTGWLMFGAMLLGLFIFAALLFVLIRAISGQGQSGVQVISQGAASPQEIIRQRYARGEIDNTTMQRMLNDLSEPPK